MIRGFAGTALYILLLPSLLVVGCATAPDSSFLGQRAHKDYYIITSQMHSYKQEFKEVDTLLAKAKRFFPEDKQIGLYHAHIKASLGDLKGAALFFSDLLAQHPLDELVLSSAAEFYFEVGRKEIALVLYTNLKKINPKKPDYWIQEGRILLEFGKVVEAAASFIHVATNMEESYKGHYQLGKLYKMTGQVDKAVMAYGNCNQRFEGCLLEQADMLWLLNEKRAVLNSLERFLVKKPNSLRILAALTDFYYSEKMFDEAASTLERIERVDPRNKAATRRLAQLMIKKKNFQGALERYEMLISSGEVASEKDRVNLANLYILMENYKNAFNQLDKIKVKSKLYPELVATKYKLYLLNEGAESAHGYIVKENRRVKSNQSGYILAKSYLRRDNYKKACEVLDDLILRSPEFVEGIHLRGLVAYEMGERDRSMEYFEKVIVLNDSIAPAFNFIAYHLAEKNSDLDRAEALVKKAAALDPVEAHYLDTLGFILYQKKEFKEARKLLEKAQKILPSEPIIAEHLADVYIELGLQNKAMQAYLLALPSLKGDNLVRVGGKIERIKSIRKLSSVSGNQ